MNREDAALGDVSPFLFRFAKKRLGKDLGGRAEKNPPGFFQANLGCASLAKKIFEYAKN